MTVLTMDEKIDQMMVDLASLKTDVTWLKRIFSGCIIISFTVIGINTTGVIV